ncbi:MULTISPECIES: HEAT repeat domain-containing protein [unclassified Psychrobacter]|uniref:HEAT repeat domain-containing protein n=1 Tax=unclassified Psychrobacter TaxID=196806 RepID=UPI0018F57D85|nr:MULTISPECIES: HEAT repeat domain-containing protein [unclassified Psychrobacter]
MKTSTLAYWGEIIGIISQDACLNQYGSSTHNDKSNNTKNKTAPTGRSLFITRLPERDPQDKGSRDAATPKNDLYVLDTLGARPELNTLALPVAMQCITANSEAVFLLGVDNHLYQTDWHAKTIQKISTLPIYQHTSASSNNVQPSALDIVPLTHAVAVLYAHTLVVCPYADTAKRLSTSPIVQPLAPLFAQHHDAADITPSDNGDNSTKATMLASSSDGQWLIIGDDKGTIVSCQWRYDGSEIQNSHIQPSSTQPMHQGRITALAFVPHSPYFYSAGADNTLYRTHIQGDLQPTDRAKSSGHASHIKALCVSSARLFTAGNDGSIKSWALDKGQPSSSKDNLTNPRYLAWTHYAEAPALLAITKDNSLHFLPVNTDSNHSLQPIIHSMQDGYARIEHYLADSSNEHETLFNQALTLLLAQDDSRALAIIKKVLSDTRTSSAHAQALVNVLSQLSLSARIGLLEQLLNSTISPQVRLAAFEALEQHYAAAPLSVQEYLTQALASRHDEVVNAAIQQHQMRASNEHLNNTSPDQQHGDRQYSQMVLPALLSHNSLSIRRAALIALEAIFPVDSIQADMLALSSRYTDTVQAGLIRLYQRGLLSTPKVTRQLMLLQQSSDSEVRQTAFFIALLAKPELADALQRAAQQQEDSYLLRTLADFDAFSLTEGTLTHTDAKNAGNITHDVRLALQVEDFQSADDKKTGQGKKKESVSKDTLALDEATLAPLLQALSNHYQDISFRAAYALACLKDARAFGVLIGFIHSDDAIVRAGVARALGNQRLADAQTLLGAMLNDSNTQVRKVAMQALGKVCSDTQTWAAFGFASAHAHIHEDALALLLQQNLAKISDEALITQFKPLLDNRFPSVRLEVLKVLTARVLLHDSASLYQYLQLIATSQFEDVHRAGLEEWQRFLFKNTRKVNVHEDNANDGALLALLLCDPFRTIRHEALETAGDYPQRFNIEQVITAALASPFEDIVTAGLQRCGTLTEPNTTSAIMPLLLPLLAAEGLEVRKTALDVALQLVTHGGQISSEDANDDYLALLNAGIQSPYTDIQLKTATFLARHSQRVSAHNMNNTASHKTSELAAIYSQQAYDVFERYLQQVMPDKKQDKAAYTLWHQQVTQALIGLAALAEPQTGDAFGWYQRYLNHSDADFSAVAPYLMWVTDANRTHHIEALQHWQRDERTLVQQSASIALGVLGSTAGEVSGAALYQQTDQNLSALHKDVSPMTWLQGRMGLGIDTAWTLAPLFNISAYVPAARWTLLFTALSEEDANKGAALLVNALSFVDAQSAILYAHCLARLTDDKQAVWEHIHNAINKALQEALTELLPQVNDPQTAALRQTALAAINSKSLQSLAALLHAPRSSLSPLLKATAVQALGQLSLLLTEPKMTHIQAWLGTMATLNHHLPVLASDKTTSNDTAEATDSNHYQSLAFGTWLGVIRNANANSVINQAIRGLLWLAKRPETMPSGTWSASITQALLPLLNHSRAETRALVWEALHELPITLTALAQEAMATEHRDMVAAGVKLWVAEHRTDSTLTTTFSQRLRDAHPLLAEEIYQYLVAAIGQLPASLAVLEYADTPLVRQVINTWQQTGLQDKDAHQQFLQHAIYVYDWQARYHAWQQLLAQPTLLNADPQLLEALLTYFMLSHTEYAQEQVLQLINKVSQYYAEQHSIVTNAQQARLNEWLFALLDDPRRRISRSLIYRALASTRALSVVTGLQARLTLSYQDHNHRPERANIMQALIKVSGFDQPIHDYFDEYEDTRWLTTQYPRHPVILMDVFSLLLRVQDSDYVLELVSPLAWIGRESDDKDDKTATPADTHMAERIDALLAQAYAQLPEKRRLAVVKAIAYRAQYRHGDTAVLKQALSSRQEMVSFIAAEALAKVGIADGASLLMATMVHHTDGDVRRRSVLAIGALFDTPEHPDAAPVSTDILYQAYERLVQYAEDEMHYLQDVACEALGMLADGGRFEYSTQVFELLKAQLHQPNLSPYNPAIMHWLHGLRRLGTPAAWAEIRQYISGLVTAATYSTVLRDALYLLSFSDNEGNKALLLNLLTSTEQPYVFASTYQAAQKLWGTDKTCQPYDWAAIQSRQQTLDNEDMALSLQRITEYSSVDAIIDFMLTHGEALSEHIRHTLAQRILQDDAIAPETLMQLLTYPDDSMLSIALAYLGQHQSAITSQTLSMAAERLAEAQRAWQALMQRIGSAVNDYSRYEMRIHALAKKIALALWLLYRYSAATNASDSSLITSLTWLTRISQLPIIASLPALSEHVEAWWQQVWLALLARPESEMTELSELLPTLQALPPLRLLTAKTNALRIQVIERLTPTPVVKTDINTTSTSPALLSWIQTQNTEALYHCASDETQTISTRLQAIEALGQMFDTRVSAWLDSLMQHTQPDIQKTAYNVKRRWQRGQNKAQNKRPMPYFDTPPAGSNAWQTIHNPQHLSLGDK